MRIGFYTRLAWNNIRKNAKLYLPNIFTGIGLMAIFYIMFTLYSDDRISQERGGVYLVDIMPLGVFIVALLSLILLCYTNSFLMKQRNREFGLYNVLGMEKRHIGKILFWETMLSAIFILAGGLVCGIVFYKLCALLLCRILGVDSVLGFYHISVKTLLPCAVFFLVLHLFIYLMNRIRIARLNPIELLQSTSVGEKEPRIRWPILVIGLVSLLGGYYISVTTQEPIKALELFFAAVLLVILGTYCLFLTGSIALLKLLKNNPKFYYKKGHMVAVSGLLYRMKQNAVGLASISILATMVLVMLSTTVSMYAGIDDTIRRQYTHQLSLSASYDVDGVTTAIPLNDLLELMQTAASENDLTISYSEQQHYLRFAGLLDGNHFSFDRSIQNGSIIECWFLTADEYETLTGKTLSLSENQMAVYGVSDNKSSISDVLTVGSTQFQCTSILKEYPISMAEYALVDCYGFVVSDNSVFQEIYEMQKNSYQEYASEPSTELVLDFSDEDAVSDCYDDLFTCLRQQILQYLEQHNADDTGYSMRVDSKWDTIEYLYGMYGTLLFLGILLSLVFLFATALIIYYKQISEGYEDRNRFQIMQKVGMSTDEVKGTIRSQILLVFFLPLVVAALHVAFAFPILTRLLRVLFLSDQTLFLICTFATLGVFALIYVLIYRITARIYYQIVR